jgi:cytochrome oxidase assembly protein ShyY1
MRSAFAQNDRVKEVSMHQSAKNEIIVIVASIIVVIRLGNWQSTRRVQRIGIHGVVRDRKKSGDLVR